MKTNKNKKDEHTNITTKRGKTAILGIIVITMFIIGGSYLLYQLFNTQNITILHYKYTKIFANSSVFDSVYWYNGNTYVAVINSTNLYSANLCMLGMFAINFNQENLAIALNSSNLVSRKSAEIIIESDVTKEPFIKSIPICEMNYWDNVPIDVSATTNSTYQGIVQAIYTNNQSSTSAITFTTGLTWHGNLSRVSNLSIGADCTLILNKGSLTFSSGACK